MENSKENSDYYAKQVYEFLVEHGLETKVLAVLKEKFLVDEVIRIRAKPEDNEKLNGE